ncbi:uncharacterized protein ARB_00321 [Trichophyton benhamiae CBS 112371]|uniref:Mitochondrial import inner membrane translocase subunit TIM22 n=1 Tax=Arthroderma benhamiae (strain ATCC MYA-4681 / CBS 112371) TaxID=663331 RepID=D4AVV7_ARTBC|nr:uncharacterized protein ARB_00321 [Trichophyton benhamiae CBS 112371]EFE32863.1 hypothetical protein ARB_00321 [Trichophyton benhamiae CBS 112371]
MGSLQTQVPPQEDDGTLSAVFDNNNPPRLGTDVGIRLPLSAMAAFASGMALGASHGSTKAAFRFRAENAHRFPTNPAGWYQYHKSKNYTSMIGGLKEGTKLGMKVGIGAVAFCIFEETVDHARENRDFLSTVTAGLSFSGVYSLLAANSAIAHVARHDVYTAARTAKVGLKLSLAYGLLQDLFASFRGSRPQYIQFIFNVFGKPGSP